MHRIGKACKNRVTASKVINHNLKRTLEISSPVIGLCGSVWLYCWCSHWSECSQSLNKCTVFLYCHISVPRIECSMLLDENTVAGSTLLGSKNVRKKCLYFSLLWGPRFLTFFKTSKNELAMEIYFLKTDRQD